MVRAGIVVTVDAKAFIPPGQRAQDPLSGGTDFFRAGHPPGHTGVNVPVYAVGSNAYLFNTELDNTDIFYIIRIGYE